MKAAVARLIEDERPDVVHTNNLQGISVSAWHAAKAARVPILHTLRDYYLTCGRCSRYRDGRNCARTCWDCLPVMLARRRASALVDGVVGVSRFIRDHHDRLGFFPHARLQRVIYNFAAPINAMDTPAPKPRLRFGYLGRLTPAKGLDVMLDAFSRQTRSDWELCIAGEGDEAYTRSLRARCAEMENRGAVRFVGVVDSAEFLAQVDVAVVPSVWNEPLARVIGEAYAAGVPVIASRSGGIPEVVQDGVNGRLFDRGDAAAMSRVVSEFLDDPMQSRRLGKNARRSLTADFHPPAALYRDAYEAVAQAPAASISSR
jgi:glycosyltransferase involved in cell wall biosynthesis